jgi:hypothetical protein
MRGSSVVWVDLLWLILSTLLVAIVYLLMLINDPNENQDEALRDLLIVDIYWAEPYRGADVDLWVLGPLDNRAVGYSNKTGLQFSLIRDVISRRTTLAPINHEQAGSQALVDGTYTVNLHLYRLGDAKAPLPVSVVVSILNKNVLSRTVELFFHGQEVTVFNFTLKDGAIVNVNELNRPIRDYSGK